MAERRRPGRRAVRKTVSPSPRAPPPSRVISVRRGTAHTPRSPAPHVPSQQALPASPIPVSSSHEGAQNPAPQDGLTQWERLFPRTEAAKANRARAPVSFEPVARGERLTLPADDATLTQAEHFQDQLYKTVMSGRSVSVALGRDGKDNALKFMSDAERDMLENWEEGQKLPDVDWESLRGNPALDGDRELWRRRARNLNGLYNVDCVDEAAARAWWSMYGALAPLVSAYGAVEASRAHAECNAMKAALDSMDEHARYAYASVASYSTNLESAIFTIKETLKSLRRDDALSTRSVVPSRRREEGAEEVIDLMEDGHDPESVPPNGVRAAPQLPPDSNGHDNINAVPEQNAVPASDIPPTANGASSEP